MKNLSSARLSAQQIQDLNLKIDEIRAAIPYMTSMSIAEKMQNQNMGISGLSRGKVALKTSKTHAQVLSKEFDTDAFESNIQAHEDLQPLYQNLESLLNNLGDTLAAYGQNIMAQSNDVYAAIKRAAKKEAKYRGAYEELRSFYKKSKSKKSTLTQDNQP